MNETIFTDLEVSLLENVLNPSFQALFLSTTPEQAKELHAIAYRLYRDRRYTEATHVFRSLSLLDPTSVVYWTGLGASLQMTKAYEEALGCYYFAQALNEDQGKEDPYLSVYVADCFFALKQVEKGLKALETAGFHAKKDNNQSICDHVHLMQKLWSPKKEQHK